jgi:hypothetical protein
MQRYYADLCVVLLLLFVCYVFLVGLVVAIIDSLAPFSL